VIEILFFMACLNGISIGINVAILAYEHWK
jgi:hypothetical protein